MNTIDNQAIINKRPFVSFKFFSKAKLFLNLVSLLVVMFVSGDVIGQIYNHNFGTTNITTKPYTVAPNTMGANLSNSSWTTSASGWNALSGNGGSPSMSLSLANSSGTNTYTLTFDVASGYQVAISHFNFWRARSNTGASNWSMSINGSSVGSGTVPTSGASIGSTAVGTSITGLTGTVTVIITLTGATGTGTFRLDDFALFGSVTVISPTLYTWTGNTSTDWATTTNWNPNGVPDGTINMTIPSNVTNSPVLTSLTVASGKTLTLQAGAKLTMSGNLTNDGTVNIGNGATIVQTGSGSNAGSGSYSMKQAISGGTTRSYYMGSPLTSATSGVFTPTSSGGNLMYTYDASQTTPVWTQVIDNSTALEIGKGYVVKMTANDTLNFTGTSINNGSIDIPCYRQASGSYLGFNLVSNPYPSYLDWDDVYAGNSATNFQSTIWYRLANTSNNMVFDTYNAPAGTGTNTSLNGAASRYIAPMQAFWVNIPSGGASSTNLSLTNAMREHYVSGVAGLRSTAQDFPAFLRLNMIQGNNLDQLIIFAKPEASENFESYDSEKMFLTGVPQFYSTVGSKNLVINGIKNNHRKSAVPLTMVLPNAGMFVFEAEELHIENGAIILEDRLENTFQDLTLNETYSFQSAAGTISDRFVIHFHLLSPEFVTDDFEVNELSASISDVSSETSEIHVLSNGKGQISVSLPENEMSDAILEVIDASGRTILKKNLIEKESIINLDNCSGIYYVRVASAQNIEFQKIFVQP